MTTEKRRLLPCSLKNRIGQSFSPAVDKKIQRWVCIIDAYRDHDRVRTFGFRSEDFKLPDLTVVAVFTPTAKEIFEGVRRAGLPELIGFPIVPLLESGQKSRYGML